MVNHLSFFNILCLVILLFSSQFTYAQCNANETKVKVTIRTDAYGYETFWQLKRANGTVLKAGGNSLAATPGSQCAPGNAGALPNNTFRRDSVCVTNFTSLKFIVYDCFGDGFSGAGFAQVEADGQIIANFSSFTIADSVLFSVPLPQTDLSVKVVDFGDEVSVGKHVVSGVLRNNGVNSISSFQLNWQIDNGIVRKQNFSSVTLAAGEEYAFKHQYGWDADAVGNVNLKVWVSNVNNNADEFAGNDSITKAVEVFQNKRVVLLETFTNASCGPCAQYMPAIENILDLSKNYAVSVAYHSDFPGYDIMNTHNPQQVESRGNYYNVSSYPSWFIDGDEYGGVLNNKQEFLTRADVPATFNIDNMQIAIRNDSLIASADAVAISAISGNFRAHAVVVERVMDYTNGPNPGSNGEEIFDWVMKYMLTDVPGQSIGSAFVGGQSVNFGGSWKLANVQDTNQLAVVFWVQNNQGKEVQNTNIAFLNDNTDYNEPQNNTSVFDKQNELKLSVFPNPAQHELFVSLNLNINVVATAQVKLYDMLGKETESIAVELINGKALVLIDAEKLDKGMYLVQVQAENYSAMSKVFIQY